MQPDNVKVPWIPTEFRMVSSSATIFRPTAAPGLVHPSEERERGRCETAPGPLEDEERGREQRTDRQTDRHTALTTETGPPSAARPMVRSRPVC